MALSPATGLANYSAGISSSVLTVDSNSDRVGIGTTNPQDTLQVGTAITMGSGTITATQGNFQNVSIAGTLTYEDTTSVDSVGIITAQSGINITGGGLSVVGDTDLVGDLTGVNATGISTINNVTGTTLNVTGVSTLGNLLVGGGTTDLVVNGDARITGILTMGTHSITLDGTQNKIISGKYDFLGISTSHNDTAVDVFIYDTTKDSDGGEWRKRTNHTSWYNETLNTATRGSRREFPAVAVIVAEADRVTIYDGDDPDLPTWMVFESGSYYFIGPSNRTKTSVHMLNGILCVGMTGSNSWMSYISFVDDTARQYSSIALEQRDYFVPILNRNSNNQDKVQNSISAYAIVNDQINDVAMTVIPNASIDATTGLPGPTIVVATAGGFSIINDDGTVTSGASGSNDMRSLSISDDNVIYFGNNSQGGYYPYDLNTGEYIGGSRLFGIAIDGPVSLLENISNSTNKNVLFTGDGGQSLVIGMDDGLNLIDGNPRNNIATNGMIAYATTSYNTGWMHGSIQGAFLSDTDTANITFTNLSTNGDFGESSDLASWTAYNSTLTHQTDAVRVADNGDYSKAYQSFTTESGKRYIATVNCKTLSGSDAVLGLRADNPGVNTWAPVASRLQSSSTGKKQVLFTATGATSYIELGSTGAGYAEYNNLRIDEVKAEDRSVNDNPLEVFGTITKTAVATGADLVAYSGFNNSNYLEQQHHSGMEVGTGDFYVMGWFKGNSDTYQSPFEISSPNVDNNGVGSILLFIDHPSDTLQFYTRNNSSGAWGNGGVSFINDNVTWNFVCCVRRGGSEKLIYMNGLDPVTIAPYPGDLTETDSIMRLGARSDTSPTDGAQFGAFTGSLSLWRFGLGAPTSEQIKKIYENEKHLYQENAQATLYGSSDTATALAYDEVTDQLHVGTSDGRSDFQGLRRINNTTTAVTTAISANDSFIVEQ